VDDGVAAAARLTEHEQVVTFVGDIEPQVHRADCAGWISAESSSGSSSVLLKPRVLGSQTA
jgi:hypothetical protein